MYYYWGGVWASSSHHKETKQGSTKKDPVTGDLKAGSGVNFYLRQLIRAEEKRY